MILPEKWLKNTTDTFITYSSSGYTYRLNLKRRYVGWFGKLKEEILFYDEWTDRRVDYDGRGKIETSENYKRLLSYKNEIDNRLAGNSPNLRKQALDALASDSIYEKDKFIADWIETSDSLR